MRRRRPRPPRPLYAAVGQPIAHDCPPGSSSCCPVPATRRWPCAPPQVVYCIIDTGMDASHPDLGSAVVNGCIDLPTTPCAQWDQDVQVGRRPGLAASRAAAAAPSAARLRLRPSC
jgi:hypothetical protein